MSLNIKRYADRDMLAIDVVNRIATELDEALLHQDRAMLAVPGGTSPGPIFDDLCAADLDWARVDVVLTDERWVPEDHDRSNTRLIRDRLLVNRAAAARLIPLYIPAERPEDVLPELEVNITPDLPISVLLLGMGADMHTASLFPQTDGLGAALDKHAPVLVPMRPESQPDIRISFSARVLDGALSKHLVIFGGDKLEALDRAMKLSPEEAPIRAVSHGLNVHWAE